MSHGLCFPGKRPLADVWALDTAAKPYEWHKLEPEGEGPPPCMYASVSMNFALLDTYFVITICILVLNSYEHVIGFVCFFKFLKPICRDRKSTRLNSSHYSRSRMPSSA